MMMPSFESTNTANSGCSCEIPSPARPDVEAFEVLYQTYGGYVQRLCRRMLRNPTEAEDVAQDVFLQVFRKIHTYRGESAFSTWLYRVAVNFVIRRLRQEKIRSTSLCEPLDDSHTPRETVREDLQLSGLFDRMNLEAAIRRLPHGCKAAFLLHDIHGYRHREISAILGYSIGNSKSQLHKARKRLRSSLAARQRRGTHGRLTPNPTCVSGRPSNEAADNPDAL